MGDCENGKQASEFVKEHPVDIVLTDILMPYMDGMELSNFLHDNYPEIVIVIFSGFGEFEYAKKAIQYGVSEYLLKPVTAICWMYFPLILLSGLRPVLCFLRLPPSQG